MPPKKLARRLNEPNGSGLDVLRVEGCEQVETDGAPSASRKLTQELAVVPEVDAQALRYREDAVLSNLNSLTVGWRAGL